MKKSLKALAIVISITMLNTSFFPFPVSSAAPNELYYLNEDSLRFDLDTMTNSLSTPHSDLWYRYIKNEFVLENGVSMVDLGEIDYDTAKAPVSGYSTDNIPIIKDHVYAARSSDKRIYILKVTNVVSESDVEFMAKQVDLEEKLELYYLNTDFLRFDLDTMANSLNIQNSDLWFRYIKNEFVLENGASMVDLGAVNYDSAKAPTSGYSTENMSIIKNHVYAVRSSSKKFYILKVTNVIRESDVEFLARIAEIAPVKPQNENKTTNPLPNNKQNPSPADKGKPAVKKIITNVNELYWVENGVRFILGGKILFEDNLEILDPFLSPDKKFVVYSNGSYDLLLYDISKKKRIKIYQLSGLDNQINYRVYPVGWSQDGKEVAFITSHKGGFLGGNQLCILNLSSKKVSVVAKGLSSADWAKNGKFVIAGSGKVWLVDKFGRNKITLKVPTARAFFGADNVSFTADSNKVIYIVAEKYYMHDIKKNTYVELSIPSEAALNGTVRSGKDGRIAVIEDAKIYIFNPANNDYTLLYEDAESSTPNWINR